MVREGSSTFLQYHKGKYYNLLTSCTLVKHLADINEETTALEVFSVQEFVFPIIKKFHGDKASAYSKYMAMQSSKYLYDVSLF